ncbi:MAG: amidohydrolase family protein [Acidobacteriota bacterium]
MALKERKLRRLILAALLLALLSLPLFWSSWLVHQLGGAFDYAPGEMAEGLSPQARDLIQQAYRGLRPGLLFDYHLHVVGLGTGGSGIEVNPEMRSWRHLFKRIQFDIYRSAAGIQNLERADQEYAQRLVALVRGFPAPGRHLLLAFDRHYNPDGTPNPEKTEFYVPNQYVFDLAARWPDLFKPGISIHPYRPDAVQALEKWALQGGRIVKWLPNAMGIDPADPKCDPFYARMAQLGLVLLSHAGEEKAVESEEDQELGNPLRLRRPLDQGVRVIMAHCASLGENLDLDHPGRPPVPSFDLFLRLMEEERYQGLLFGEISALTQTNRMGRPLRTLLQRSDLHPRLVHGSDYPLPAINLLISTRRLQSQGYLSAEERSGLNEVYQYNPLLFDLVLKRLLKHPESGQSFPASVFQAHPELQPWQ